MPVAQKGQDVRPVVIFAKNFERPLGWWNSFVNEIIESDLPGYQFCQLLEVGEPLEARLRLNRAEGFCNWLSIR
jgi:hypothetical protein